MLKILNTSTVTSTFQLPDQTPKENTVNSNESSTEYMTTAFEKKRTSEKEFAAPTEEVKQTLTLTNNSEMEVDNIRIADTISEATFKEGSMEIDGESKPELNPANYSLENPISPNDSVVITYIVTVNENHTASTVNIISDITYDVVDVENLNEKSNEVELQIVDNLITIEKTSDKTAVIKGQTLMFQSVITNKGNQTNTKVTFKDPIPEGTKFVTGSVKIDDVPYVDYDPAVGFELGEMEPNKVITVTFDVTVE